ncbi:MAG: hypothetical protein V7629_17795 [Motiliproteus sp.]
MDSQFSTGQCSSGQSSASQSNAAAIKVPSFAKSLRPFSLVVALVSCGLGVTLALLEQQNG